MLMPELEEAHDIPEYELLASYQSATDSGMVVDSGATRSCGSIAALERLQTHFLELTNGRFDGIREFNPTKRWQRRCLPPGRT